MTDTRTKETAVLAPSLWQGLRSARSYLSRPKPDLGGTISNTATTNGQQFVVYLPPGHGAERKDFPVLYHLHGAGMKRSWVNKDITWIATEHEKAVAMGFGEPMIIVGAYDPSRFSMWSDSASGENDRATAVLTDLIPHVEAVYQARTDRSSRFIQGFSMGGFGAASIGLRNQDLFAAIVIWDGAMHDWNTLNQGRSRIATNQFADDKTEFDKWSPWIAAESADLTRTTVLIVAGLMEDYNQRFRNHLNQLGAKVSYASVDCLHDMRCLQQTYGQQAFQLLANV